MGRLLKWASRFSLGLAVALLAIAAPLKPLHSDADAAQGDVYFSGSVTEPNACVIFVDQDGILAQAGDPTSLSSKNAGGLPGRAYVISFWAYDVSVDTIPFFTSAPTGGNDNTSFAATFAGTSVYRGRDFAEQPGNSPVRLRYGYSVTLIDVNLAATRPDPFPAGNYETHTVLRCE